MVVRRRAAIMGVVTLTALVLSVLYFWRVGDDHGLVPFLLGLALLLIAVVHGVAWHESRVPLLTVDMTGLMIRLGGRWVALPWNEVELIEIADPGRIGDGRVTVRPRDERRALAVCGARSRFAALLNRWLYDASLVVPYGVTARASVPDVLPTVSRLADGRVPVVVAEREASGDEPKVAASSVEVSTFRSSHPDGVVAPTVITWVEPKQMASEPVPERVPEEAPDEGSERTPEHAAEPETAPEPEPVAVTARVSARQSAPPAHRRLAAVVSALRSTGGRRGATSAPVGPREAVVGALALAETSNESTEALPELHELRRRPPEEEVREQEHFPLPDLLRSRHLDRGAEVDSDDAFPRSANVELVIDATADLSAGAMRGIRQHEQTAQRPVAVAAVAAGTQPPAPARPAAALAIGATIRTARERLDVSVDDLAERTRIRPYVIESIELGDFSPCGGDFYARGHLTMLTGALGVDPAPLLASYDESLASAPVSPRAVFDAELATGVVRPAGSSSHWGALVAAVLILLLVWGVARFFASDTTAGPHSMHAPSAAVVLAAPQGPETATATALAPPAG